MTKIWINKVILNWLKGKVSKNVGVLFKGSLHLIRHAYQYISHWYIYKYVSFIGFGNTAWASTSHSKYKKVLSKTCYSNYIHEGKEAYARPFWNLYLIISYKFLHLSTFEEIELKYLTRFSKYHFRQPPALINYENTSYLLGGCNYGI